MFKKSKWKEIYEVLRQLRHWWRQKRRDEQAQRIKKYRAAENTPPYCPFFD